MPYNDWFHYLETICFKKKMCPLNRKILIREKAIVTGLSSILDMSSEIVAVFKFC